MEDQVGDEAHNQVGNESHDRVGDKRHDQVRNETRRYVSCVHELYHEDNKIIIIYQVIDEAHNQVGDEVHDQIGDEAHDHVGADKFLSCKQFSKVNDPRYGFIRCFYLRFFSIAYCHLRNLNVYSTSKLVPLLNR